MTAKSLASPSLVQTRSSETGLTEKQLLGNEVLGSAKHVLLRGGSRSGKTFLIVRAIVTRALKAPKSTHAIFRQRFNHLKLSIIADTVPAVMKICYPHIPIHLDKTDWFHELPNGARLVYGGLDDKERTEKVLGQEHSTIYLNEASQISYSARNMALTRLAQNSGLVLREYVDCNPPSVGHWTYRLWFSKVEPKSGMALTHPDRYATMQLNPRDNMKNLGADYIETLEGLPAKERLRFLEGEFLSSVENALWTHEMLDHCRIAENQLPRMSRIVVAIDPSGCEGEEDFRSDEIGIVVAGRGVDGLLYILADLTERLSPEQWARRAVEAFEKWEADIIVAERNYGGAMVSGNIKSVNKAIPVKLVTASRGKHVRAEPIANLYEQKRAKHLDYFPELEEQLTSFSTSGYQGARSPDRADAMVWAATELMLGYQQSTSIGAFQVEAGRVNSIG